MSLSVSVSASMSMSLLSTHRDGQGPDGWLVPTDMVVLREVAHEARASLLPDTEGPHRANERLSACFDEFRCNLNSISVLYRCTLGITSCCRYFSHSPV